MSKNSSDMYLAVRVQHLLCQLVEEFGMSNKELAAVLGHKKTDSVRLWRVAELPVDEDAEQRLALVVAVAEAVRASLPFDYKMGHVSFYFQTRQLSLGNKTPTDYLVQYGNLVKVDLLEAVKKFAHDIKMVKLVLPSRPETPVPSATDLEDRRYRRVCLAINTLERFFPSLHEIGEFIGVDGVRLRDIRLQKGIPATNLQLYKLEQAAAASVALSKHYYHPNDVNEVIRRTSRKCSRRNLSILEQIAGQESIGTKPNWADVHIRLTIKKIIRNSGPLPRPDVATV